MRTCNTLLQPKEPAAFSIFTPRGRTPCLLVCEHASSRIPKNLKNLGLSKKDLQSHIAWDIGAGSVTKYLSRIMDAPALLANYSRLVIDLNRHTDHPTAILASSADVPVPGNQGMTQEDIQLRIEEIYQPYHRKLSALIEGFLKQEIIPAIISIHSFTPVFYKQIRLWDAGFLWAQDDRLASPAISFFQKKGFTVGNNAPYDARMLSGTTLNLHADARGLPNLTIELRNDHLDSDEKCRKWAAMIGDCCGEIFRKESILNRFEGPRIVCDPEKEAAYFEELIQKAKQGEL